MKNETHPDSVTPSSVIDFEALRLSPNYGASLGVVKLLTKVSVGKPEKSQFFRTHPSDEMTFQGMLLEQKQESYLVTPDVADVISELVRPTQLHTAIDRQDNVFLIPVLLPGENGRRNPWHESRAQAVELAKLKWVRIAANEHIGSYDVFEAAADLPPPEWPPYDMKALLEVAFRGKIIEDIDHPVVQALLGKI